MFVASKYEEMYPPEIADFAFVTDQAYTTAQIRDMEMRILRGLNFSFGRPLPLQFLRRASKIGEVCPLPQPSNLTTPSDIQHLLLPQPSNLTTPSLATPPSQYQFLPQSKMSDMSAPSR